LAHHRLARAGLADDRDGLARRHGEAHAVHGAHDVVLDLELDLEVADGQQVAHAGRPVALSASASGSSAAMPREAKLTRVVSVSATRCARAASAVARATATKPSSEESTRTVPPSAPPLPFRVSCIQPSPRSPRVE